MIKYFIFTIKYKDNLFDKTIEELLNIKYHSFKVLHFNYPNELKFQIDTQSIRKLKLNKLNNNINPIEEKLIQILENSKEIEWKTTYPYGTSGCAGVSGYSGVSGLSGVSGIIGKSGPSYKYQPIAIYFEPIKKDISQKKLSIFNKIKQKLTPSKKSKQII